MTHTAVAKDVDNMGAEKDGSNKSSHGAPSISVRTATRRNSLAQGRACKHAKSKDKGKKRAKLMTFFWSDCTAIGVTHNPELLNYFFPAGVKD